MFSKSSTDLPRYYRTLLITFIAFTLLDAMITVLGLEVGCIELNPIVLMSGVQIWALFRLLLLGSMATTFLAGYRVCSKHYQKGLRILLTILVCLNIFIVTVVFHGFLAILSAWWL